MAGELGRAISSVGQSMMERDKATMLNEMEIDAEKRADERQKAKEEREYQRQLKKVEQTKPIRRADGSWVERMVNSEGNVLQEVPLDPYSIEEIQRADQKEKASLDKILAETEMLKTYGPQIKAAELGVKLGQAEAYQTEADADRARAGTYSLDYQAARDASRAANKVPGSGSGSKPSISKATEDAYFFKDVTKPDGTVQRVRDPEAAKSFNKFVTKEGIVRDDTAVEAWQAEETRKKHEDTVRASMKADGYSDKQINEALSAERKGLDFQLSNPENPRPTSHPVPPANAVRMLWADPEKHKDRFIRDFGEAAFREAMRRKGK